MLTADAYEEQWSKFTKSVLGDAHQSRGNALWQSVETARLGRFPSVRVWRALHYNTMRIVSSALSVQKTDLLHFWLMSRESIHCKFDFYLTEITHKPQGHTSVDTSTRSNNSILFIYLMSRALNLTRIWHDTGVESSLCTNSSFQFQIVTGQPTTSFFCLLYMY